MKMNCFSRIFLSGALLFVGYANCNAQTYSVTVEPGGLSDAVTAAAGEAAVVNLTVAGSIDASDFDFISSLNDLATLDLSGATIAEYNGSRTATNITRSAANVLPDCALLSTPLTSLALPAGITELGAASLGNSRLESLTLPSSLTTIDEGAFSGMVNLKSITIPASVTKIGNMLFKDCESLESVVLQAKISELPMATFCNCTSLTSVTLPSSLTSIGSLAFAGCSSLESVTIPSGVTTIGSMAFANAGLTSIDLSARALNTIESWAFINCTNLKEITTDENLASIGKGAFFNNVALATPFAHLSANLVELPDYILYGAANSSADGFGATSVEKIGNYALSGNQSTDIEMPATVSYIGDNAMERWTQLKNVNVLQLEDVPELGESVWADTPQSEAILLVPTTLYEKYTDAPQWKEFKVETPMSSITNVTDEDANHNLRAYFDGALLLVQSDCNILGAQLYDVAGRCMTVVGDSKSDHITIDTAPFNTNIFIVRLLLDNGSKPVLKLHR
jgi:hypothetical protein